MVMMINIKKKCGNNIVTRADGEKIRNLIERNWQKEKTFEIDFDHLSIASVSFMDEAFAKLVNAHTVDEIREKLKFQNIQKYDLALLKDILISRSKQSQASKA